MIIPLCPICGCQMYFAGIIESVLNPFKINRYVCIHCDHVEDMVSAKKEDTEFMS